MKPPARLLVVFTLGIAALSSWTQTNTNVSNVPVSVSVAVPTNSVPAPLVVATNSVPLNINVTLSSPSKDNTSILPILTAILGAVLAYWFALYKFRQEKWWDRKLEAYSRIIEALHNSYEYCSAHAGANRGELAEHREKELGEEFDRGFREIKKATGIGAYIISDEVAKVLEELEKRPRLNSDENPMTDVFDDAAEGYKKALVDVRRLSKKDLKVK